MKTILTEDTLAILKNFATLNPNFYCPGDRQLRTWSPGKDVLASARVDSDFPIEFGIYDLSKLLGAMSLVDLSEVEVQGDETIKALEVEFREKSMVFGSGRSSVEYFYSDKNLLNYPTVDPKMPAPEVEFDLTWDDFKKILKACSTLGYKHIIIRPKGESLVVTVTSPSQTGRTDNSYAMEFPGDYSFETDFKLVLNTENLNLIPGDYHVSIAKGKLAEMTNKTMGDRVKYLVLLDKATTQWSE